MNARLSFLAFATLTVAACSHDAPSSAGGAKPLTIAVIPKGTTHEFWRSIHAGARQAAKEIGGIEIIWRGPEREDDRDQQVSLVQNFASQKVDAIVLAPLDHRALVAPVALAQRLKIPVVIIDSGLDGEAGKDFVSYVSTDNRLGGELAGLHMAKLLGAKGSVLMLRYAEGSESTAQREQGFVDALSQSAGITLIDPQRYAGSSRASAQEAAENLLTANPDIAGVFCSNESATFGMLLALLSRDLAGKVHFVGFDASKGLVAALQEGQIDALVVQDPVKMGAMGVRVAVAHVRGEKVELRVDTGVTVVTRANMDEPAVHALLFPDLGD